MLIQTGWVGVTHRHASFPSQATLKFASGGSELESGPDGTKSFHTLCSFSQSRFPNVIVGGGISGLIFASTFKQNKLDLILFEKSESMGGIWTRSKSSETNIFEPAYRIPGIIRDKPN